MGAIYFVWMCVALWIICKGLRTQHEEMYSKTKKPTLLVSMGVLLLCIEILLMIMTIAGR
jgi:hypothetical protein